MSELNGDDLRRRADAGETLSAHEAVYERLYWALEYWGANGQEADDAAREMLRAFVEEWRAPTVEALRDLDAQQKETDYDGAAEVAWYYSRGAVEDALGLERGALDTGDYDPDDEGDE